MSSYERALDTLSATPSILRAVVEATPAAALERRPAAEEWSVREILGHMLHVETAIIGPRIRRMLEEDEPLLTPAGPAPAAAAPGETLDTWLEARSSNLEFLRGLSPSQRQRAGRHPRYGRISAEEHAVEWAYHDLDHLRQIFAVLQAEIYPDIGVFTNLYPKPY